MPNDDTPTPEAGETTETGAEAQEPVQLPDDHPLVKTMRSEREARKAMEAQLQEAQSALEEYRQQSLSEQEKALEVAKAEAAAETLRSLAPKLLLSEIQSAGKNLADPKIAAAMIDVQSVMGDDGTLDSEKVASALDSLIEEHPILVGSETPRPDFDGGARSTPPKKRTDMDALLRSHVQT